MHGSIRDQLEKLLGAEHTTIGHQELTHLSSCPECSSEFESMKSQSEMLRLLRAPADVEPAAGFYARVMQRVEEERAKVSMWAAFATSAFGKRLVYASLTLAVALGSYVIAENNGDSTVGGRGILAQTMHYDAPVFGDQQQQRDAVLENFASH